MSNICRKKKADNFKTFEPFKVVSYAAYALYVGVTSAGA
jgi:hypothetical protein